jgi:hypothetical protein
MTHRRVHLVAALAAALLGSATLASAQDIAAEPMAHPMGEHPAVLVKRQAQQVDTNRLILMHPAGLFVIATPTPTYDHPAVIVARMAREQPSDLDRYMAQPPVASAWLRRSELSAAAADAPVAR